MIRRFKQLTAVLTAGTVLFCPALQSFAACQSREENAFCLHPLTGENSRYTTDANIVYVPMEQAETIVYETDGRGNVNFDNSADATDASLILIYAAAQGAGVSTPLYSSENADAEAVALQRADVDKSGEIDATDASYILSYAAHIGSGKSVTWEELIEKQPITKLILSGNEDDIFITETDCYAENDEIVMYFQKGIIVKGNMLETANNVMNDLCETTGFHFDRNYYTDENYHYIMDMYFAPDTFSGINSDETKINILVVNIGDASEWADGNTAILDQSNFDYDSDNYAILYHELSHVLQFRNGVNLGSMMNEGFATYTENKARLSHNIPAWNAAQYYFPTEFDESLISGDETTFCYLFDNVDDNYQYGFRFITFLYETYGENIYADILSEATQTGFNAGYDADNMEASVKANSQKLLEIIKSMTSETVLSDFKQWYHTNWSVLGQEYMELVSTMEQ